jgi:hypothetical protein
VDGRAGSGRVERVGTTGWRNARTAADRDAEKGAVEDRTERGRPERGEGSGRGTRGGSAAEARADALLGVGREGREVLRGERAEGRVGEGFVLVSVD